VRRTLVAIGVITAVLSTSTAIASLHTPNLPGPSDWANRINNKWFPLLPGTVFTYAGKKDGKTGRDVLTVTHLHRTIEGAPATIIYDRLYLAGYLAERTTDWYAQDKQGNVWYLGESTATLNAQGKVLSTEGSWLAGVGGARAGIYMPAHPTPSTQGLQEYYLAGHAADQYKVLSLHAHASTPAASTSHALLTQETSMFEPGVLDHKLYIAGVGDVVEQSIKPGNETFTLVSVRHR